ncbi:MAG: AAA family ATPase [Methylibium sp.]|nr:AAA family ATPase [Methylibium sp.]
MVEFQEQRAEYARRYHAQGHDAEEAANEHAARAKPVPKAQVYLESGTTGRAPVFGGKGAAVMGLAGDYDRVRFLAAVVGRYQLDGSTLTDVNYKASRKTRTSKKTPYDFGEFVISAGKSWSIAIGMARTALERALLKGIVDQAITRAVEHMESLARVRVTRDGVTRWEAPVGVQYADFDHAHNRRGDSHCHRHIAVMRHAMCRDGRIRTLDMSIFMQAQYEIDAVLKTELTRLACEAGYEIEMTAHGPELRRVPKKLREACSTGTQEIAAFLELQGVDFERATHDQKAWANSKTKLAKVKFDEQHLENITRQKFASAGFDYDAFDVAPERASYPVPPAHSARDAVALALEELHERSDVVRSRYALSFAAARYRGWAGDIAELTAEIDHLFERGYLVQRGDGTGLAAQGGAKLTSQFAIERERSAVDLYKRSVGKGQAIDDAATLRRVIEELERDIRAKTGDARARLSDGQVAMIQSALLSPDRIVVCEGDPGTGKTTGMSAVNRVAHEAGWQCLGLAPSDQARDALTAAGVQSETVQFAIRSDAFWEQVDGKTVLIIDEAGMVDAADMRELLVAAEKRGARVQLVGDRKQLQSVGAGTPFARIASCAKKLGTLVELTEMNRARTVQNKALHVLSRDDQVRALQKLMQPSVAAGDRVALRHELRNGGRVTVVDVVGRDGAVRTALDINAASWLQVASWPCGGLLKVTSVQGDRLELSGPGSTRAMLILEDGGPAGRVWSNSSAAARYDFVARRYAELAPKERFCTPIIVDTNADLGGLTAAIRAKLNIAGVFEVRTFESRHLEVAQHLTSTSYEVGDCIRINSKGEGFAKDEVLTVLLVERDRLRVLTADGREKTFIPSRDGLRASLGEAETCRLGVGDFVRFTAKWSDADIRNGDRGVITAIDVLGSATVEVIDWDGVKRGTRELELGKGLVALRAGYAATVHALQGGTMNRGFYLAGSTSRNAFLVGATRFRDGFTLVADIGTKKRLEALAVRVQRYQHKEPALPTAEDIARRFRRPAVNAAWPADRSQLFGVDGRARFVAFPAQAELTEETMRYFLREAKRIHGDRCLLDGQPEFVELACRVALENPDGIAVCERRPQALRRSRVAAPE